MQPETKQKQPEPLIDKYLPEKLCAKEKEPNTKSLINFPATLQIIDFCQFSRVFKLHYKLVVFDTVLPNLKKFPQVF